MDGTSRGAPQFLARPIHERDSTIFRYAIPARHACGRGTRFTSEYAEGPIELVRCRAIIGSVAGFDLHGMFGGTQYNAAPARTSRTESKYLAANKHCSLLVADNCGLHWDQPEWKVHQQLVRFSRCHWSSVCSIIRQKNFTPAAASHIPNTTRKLVIRMPESLTCASC